MHSEFIIDITVLNPEYEKRSRLNSKSSHNNVSKQEWEKHFSVIGLFGLIFSCKNMDLLEIID